MCVSAATDAGVKSVCVPRLDFALSLGNCMSVVGKEGIVAAGIICFI